jgi:hypothetical protein
LKVAALYAVICLVALVGLAKVQLGWQPDFVAVWDLRSKLYLDGVFAFPAFISCMGLAGALPVARLPRRLQPFPGAMALSILSLILIGIVELSATSDATEVRHNLLRAAGFGVGLGLFLGVVQGFSPKEKGEDNSLTDWQRHSLVIGMMAAAVLVGLILLMQTRPRDDGNYEEFARLGGSDEYLSIGARTPPLVDESFGLVRISNSAGSNVLVLENSEWPAFAKLWVKARQMRSATWQPAGETSDTTGSDRATISVSGGPGVRFRISSPHSPTVIYHVPPSDIPRLDSAISKTGDRLGS